MAVALGDIHAHGYSVQENHEQPGACLTARDDSAYRGGGLLAGGASREAPGGAEFPPPIVKEDMNSSRVRAPSALASAWAKLCATTGLDCDSWRVILLSLSASSASNADESEGGVAFWAKAVDDNNATVAIASKGFMQVSNVMPTDRVQVASSP
jgi:hypothetical protein